MNKDELRETTEKMNYMDDLLKKNIFNNPLRDVQLNMRNELIDFRTTLQKNFSELEKYIETLQPKGTGEEGKINSEETQLIQKELDKKNYQILHLIRSFDEYEKTMSEDKEKLSVENNKLNYRIVHMERAIQDLENQLKIKK